MKWVSDLSGLCWEPPVLPAPVKWMGRGRSIPYGPSFTCLTRMARKMKLLLRHVPSVMCQVPSTHFCLHTAPATAEAQQENCQSKLAGQEATLQGKELPGWETTDVRKGAQWPSHRQQVAEHHEQLTNESLPFPRGRNNNNNNKIKKTKKRKMENRCRQNNWWYLKKLLHDLC